ncbi:MAG: SDR family oxidoreductase [Actinomycetota bacterium]|nr:SDR family oxidoreductase [Actinomycetota bacterium]
MATNSKRILVTGGGGFIGSHLCDFLLEEGHSVICLDSFITGDWRNIERARANPSFTVVEGDVCKRLDFDVDCVFHLASPASPVHYSSMQVSTLMANSLGTGNCLELSTRVGGRMVMCSSSEVYGDPLVTPQGEEYFGNVNPIGPRSCYDEGKRFAEALCKAYERERGADVVIVRIFNTYGSRMRSDDGRVIPNFINQALEGKPLTVYGDGSQTRSFCHVRDMVRGLAFAMFTESVRGEVINMGNPNEIRIIDLASIVRNKVGSCSGIEFRDLPVDDPLMRKPDISKAMSALSWAPEIDLTEGLDDAIAWFRENSA